MSKHISIINTDNHPVRIAIDQIVSIEYDGAICKIDTPDYTFHSNISWDVISEKIATAEQEERRFQVAKAVVAGTGTSSMPIEELVRLSIATADELLKQLSTPSK